MVAIDDGGGKQNGTQLGDLDIGPVRFAEKQVETLFQLICCEKKALFQQKKQAEKYGLEKKANRSITVHLEAKEHHGFYELQMFADAGGCRDQR